jgi:choline-glycine betaine transporter
MTTKDFAKRVALHVFAWILLLALGIAAILGGIFLVSSGYWSALIIRPSDATGTENVVMFLLVLTLSLGAYLVHGVTSGAWRLSPTNVILVIGMALFVLAFGEIGLRIVTVATLALYGCAWFVRRKRNGNGT